MYKRRTKIIIVIVCFCLSIGLFSNYTCVEAANPGKWVDLGQGWRFRVDGPHASIKDGKWHVHVENTRTGTTGAEGVDGSESHGDHMNKIPNKIKKKIKDHDEYKKGQREQKKLDKAANEIKKQDLVIDWAHIGDVITAIGIVIVCTATFFFQGDDFAAWINLLRALGC